MSAERDSSQESAVVVDGHRDENPVEAETVIAEAVSEIPVEAPSVGQRLRAAREAKGMTSIDVAARLKLSPHQVDALECDDWTRLQCNTITRGFVRNYARLVGLDGAELMLALDQLAKPQAKELAVPTSINVKVPTENGVESRDYVRVIGGLAVLVMAVLAYFFLPTDFLKSGYSSLKERLGAKPSAAVAAVAEPERSPVPSEASAPVAAPAASPEPAQASSNATPQPQSVALPAPTPISSVSEAPAVPSKSAPGSMKLSFSKPSWVEIKDRSGQIIFSQLSPAGSQREVSGQPPFSLVIGNAANVSLQYKGKEVDLSKRSKDDVARLTLE